MTKTPKRPRDPNQLAKMITDIAVGEIENPSPAQKSMSASEIGSLGGKKRAQNLSEKDRKEIATKAAKKRWEK